MFIDDIEKLDTSSFEDRELYEELLNIESDIDRQIAVNKVRARAKKLGIAAAFDKTWLNALKEQAKYMREYLPESEDFVTNNLTAFSTRDADYQFKCGNWIANDGGVMIKTERNGTQMVCPHPIYVTKILRNTETGKYKVEIEFKVRGKIRRLIVNREILAAPSKIIGLANDSVQITALTAPYLVKYLADLEALNPELIREYASTSRLGWIKYIDEEEGKEKYRFLPYQQEIIFDSDLSMKSLFESIQSHGDREVWYETIKDIRAKQQPEVLINLAAAFASVLVEPCNLLPFIVSLWGGTGIGKSVILKICTSVWADPGEGKYITDAKATNTAMEIRLNVLNSLPMTLDDMAQVKNTYDEDFSELIYRWCAGKGRDRSNKELGLNKLTSWKNCTITNGERSMVDESTQGGAVNRVIDIEASGEVLFDGESGSRVCKVIESNYGFAGKEFIDLINATTFGGCAEIFKEQYDLLKAAINRAGKDKEEKQIIPMALILAADYMTEKYLFEDGIRLDINKCIGYLRDKDEVSENKRAYEYLMASIAENAYRFDDSEFEAGEATSTWGYWKDGNTIVINGKIFDQIIKEGKFQSKAFLSWCKKKNIIECDARGTPKKTVTHNGQKYRAVVIKTDYGMDEDEENVDFIEYNGDELPFD